MGLARSRTWLLAALAPLLVGGCAEGDATAAPAPALPGEAPAAQAGTRGVEAPAVPADAPLVVFLGDSISAGLHLSANEAFPAVVQRELFDRGVPFRLVNAGVSGDTSAGGLRRVDWILQQQPDVVVVELGGNDGLRGQPPEAVEENLRGIVERARAAGAEVLLLGVRLPPNLGPDYVADFEAVYPRLAEELELAFVPHFLDGVGGVPEMNLDDGLHPTPEGHRRIAERVAPALGGLLGRIER
jgi:acyl-CoA thioesterase-1